jgi:hypothetical protein
VLVVELELEVLLLLDVFSELEVDVVDVDDVVFVERVVVPEVFVKVGG